MVELPFAVRVEDGTPVSAEVLYMVVVHPLPEDELRIFEWAGILNNQLTFI